MFGVCALNDIFIVALAAYVSCSSSSLQFFIFYVLDSKFLLLFNCVVRFRNRRFHLTYWDRRFLFRMRIRHSFTVYITNSDEYGMIFIHTRGKLQWKTVILPQMARTHRISELETRDSGRRKGTATMRYVYNLFKKCFNQTHGTKMAINVTCNTIFTSKTFQFSISISQIESERERVRER